MIAASALFSGMAVLVRLSVDVSPFTIVMYRFTIGIGILCVLALFNKIRLDFSNVGLLAVRGVTGGLAVFLFYLAIGKIGLAKGSVISNTYPVFATVFGAIFLKERVKSLSAIYVIACIAGLVLVNHDAATGSFAIDVWTLLAFAGSILAAVAVVAIRRLSRSDSTYSIFFSQCLFGFWIVLIPASTMETNVGIIGALLLLGVGIVATAGQLIMTWSYKHVDVSTGSLLSMLMVVFNVLIGTIFFGEASGFVSYFGMVIIIASCAGIVYTNRPGISKIVPAHALEP